MNIDIENVNKYFGTKLRELRTERNLTQSDLAKELGVTKSTISRYETGVHSPQISHIKHFADYFDVNPYWLSGMSDEKYIKKDIFIKIPVLGTIAAGHPIIAEEYIEDYEYIKESECVDFCLKIKGDSMINARIYDGDIVFIRKQDDVENGEVAAVLIDDEATLKRVYKVNGTVILHAENPIYTDMVFSAKDYKQVRILGKAMSLKTKIK